MAILKLAKVTNPTRLNVLPRRRLFNLLDRMRKRPVIWITGPAGSGKTTLVSSYLGARKLPCLWYQLDEDDSDPATFFYYLGEAAKKAARRKQKPLLLFTPEYRQGIPTFTRRYFENLYERLKIPSALVFDNYQDVPEGSPFHEIVLHGLTAAPEGLNIILISRKDPPPVFVRLQASPSMEILGWNKLRLTLQESAGIVRLRSRVSWPREWLRHLYQMTDGWAAGLVLMVEKAKREGVDPQAAGRFTPEEIFRYFSIEIFDKTDEDMQNFLLKTAFLPKMTARMAQELTGLPSSARLLSSLSRDNYFTAKSFQNEPIYQYHPLFRDFLSERAREIFPPGSLSTLLGRAAKILEEAGQVEDAVLLLQEVGDWDALVRVILKQASLMADQGRYRPLEDWLSSLPGEIMENHPWLLQWMGTCQLPCDPPQSQPYFEKAFERFKARNEGPGIIVALWSIVESIRTSGGDLKQLDRWISVLEDLSLRFKAFPSPESELRFVSMMIGALIYRQPQHPEIRKWTERAFSLAQRFSSTELMDLKLEILSHLNMFYNLTGDFEKATAIIDALKNMSQARNVRPIVRIWVKRAESIHYRCTVQHEKCLKAVSDGLELSRTTGIHVVDHFLLTQGISSALNMNDLQRAEGWLEKEALSYPVLGSWHRSLYHLQKARLGLLRGDLSQAAFHADSALTLSAEAGSPYTLGFSHIVNSLVKHVLGKPKEARDHLGEVFDVALKMKAKIYEFSALLLEALFAFDQGEEESGRISLRKALALGKERKYFYPYIDLPGRMASLCTMALENGIEVEYVQELIRRLNILSDQPPLHLENWPWRLRIYTLGRFEILRDGKPIRFSRKAQQKPLSLVKALVALGGMEVRKEQIADILWPEADGDAAHRSFEITLYRLRKLIGIHDAVQLQEGRLTLNPKHCWVDVWAFDHFLGRSEAASQKEGMKNEEAAAIYRIQKAIDLCRGVFLPGETSESWTNSLRERIRSRFLRCVKKSGHYWEKTGHLEKAVECFQKGLEVDDLIEDFYRSLMSLFQRMGRRTEALSVYQRCKNSLSIALGVDPSPETQALRQSLLADKKS